MIHAHSSSEVIAGFLLGAAGSALFLLMQSRCGTHTLKLSWGSLASVVIIPALLLNTGAKAPTQSLLSEIAVKLGPLEKPFTRADLHKRFY
jgi:hypothetical protein